MTEIAAEPMSTTPRICGHCQRPARGSAQLNETRLCHPDEGMDCYRLVTVHQHPMPCTHYACARLLEVEHLVTRFPEEAADELRKLGYMVTGPPET